MSMKYILMMKLKPKLFLVWNVTLETWMPTQNNDGLKVGIYILISKQKICLFGLNLGHFRT